MTAPQPENRWSFSLAALLALVTYCAVTLGVMLVAPGIGIALLVIAGPAILRAAMLARRWRMSGAKVSPAQQVLTFAGSLVVVTTIALASTTAFAAVCFPLGGLVFEGVPQSTAVPLFYGGWALGIAMGLLVGGILLYHLWVAHLSESSWKAPPEFRQRLNQYTRGVVLGLTPAAGALAGVGVVAVIVIVWRVFDPQARQVWTPVPVPGADGQLLSYRWLAGAGLLGLVSAMFLTRRSLPAKIVLLSGVIGGILGAVISMPLLWTIPGSGETTGLLALLVLPAIGCGLGAGGSWLSLAANVRQQHRGESPFQS